jgi:cyclophilin family peptidyl-prolyl cis-trans isomerase
LDNQYTVFGCTIEGMDAVDAIVQTPTRDRNGSVVPDEAVELIRVRIEPYAG